MYSVDRSNSPVSHTKKGQWRVACLSAGVRPTLCRALHASDRTARYGTTTHTETSLGHITWLISDGTISTQPALLSLAFPSPLHQPLVNLPR